MLGGAALQIVTAASIVTYDQFRKRRIPGGFEGFPHLPPTSAELAGNELTVYTNGQQLYDDMLKAINEAEHSVFFESFIWKGDDTGKAFKEAMINAAARGVHVYCIYDTFANLVVNPAFKIFPHLENLHILRFPILRPDMFLIKGRLFGRDHRKLLIVDGKVGWVGGYNIGDLYATEWRDTQIKIEGPAVWELENAFVEFWNEFKRPHHPELPDRGARAWDSRIQAVANTPSRLTFPIRGHYLDAIARASKQILITQAYFIPDREFIDALKRAAKRGVEVKILIPERSNHVLADWAAATTFTELLDAGIQIWLYQHAMVHAKTATIDGRWTTVGTANIDRLSLQGNFEVNVILTGKEPAQVMEKVFLKDMSTARELKLKKWANRPRFWLLIERIVRPMRFWL
ncbi:cardiolipin synthase B [Boudabousia liubingyangii]|uniref:Cardiolipin synthase B n=1 Tax=Boudabousia liubingyangii TaxID=1921764 RepID=A0A1Q5PQP0_9ACTO|nr:cardiolipin synthase B [Boudabousia liubingyangii]OKL49894.1 cardiolipin synthase B [Boudabousia liubingyangii]